LEFVETAAEGFDKTIQFLFKGGKGDIVRHDGQGKRAARNWRACF
jgi:hypothetical protein